MKVPVLLITRICDAIEAFNEPMTAAEIADLLNVPLKAVKGAITRSRSKTPNPNEKRRLRCQGLVTHSNGKGSKCFRYGIGDVPEIVMPRHVTPTPKEVLSAEADACIAKWMPDLRRLKGNPFATVAIQVGGGL